MVRWSKPKARKHDFLYLSFLVIVSSGLVTLILFGLYCWYDTGKFPLLYGIQAMNINEDSIRFWIGSIYVPIFMSFAGIIIAHRLIYNPGGSRLSPALNDDLFSQMATESDSRTLENILDILSGADAANIEYRGMNEANPGRAQWELNHQLNQPPYYSAMSWAYTPDNGSEFSIPLTLDMTDEIQVQDERVEQIKMVSPVPKGDEADPLPQTPNDHIDTTVISACDHSAEPMTCAPPENDKYVQAEKKEPTKEVDFIEQLRDPVNREKLVALLVGIDI